MSPGVYDNMRQAMVVSQLRPNAVTDARVIDAMSTVPREEFVPEDRRSSAYADVPVTFPDGRAMNMPLVTGRLLSEAAIRDGDAVLIIGSAAEYTRAIVSALTAHVSVAHDASGAPEGAPYDVIVIDGAVEFVPDELVAQLAVGGRIVAGLAQSGVTRLAIGTRTQGGFGLVAFADAEVVLLPGFSKPRAFVF